jgi:hypothetical protein
MNNKTVASILGKNDNLIYTDESFSEPEKYCLEQFTRGYQLYMNISSMVYKFPGGFTGVNFSQ